MTPPPELFPGVVWTYEVRAIHHQSAGGTRKGHCWSCYELGAPVDVTVWDDGTATADVEKSVECASVEEAVQVCRSRLRSLRDELNRLDPVEGPDWRKRAEGEFPEGVHLRAIDVYIKGKFAYWDIEVGCFDEEGEFVTTCGDVSGWGADAGTRWAPIRIPEDPGKDADQ